MPIKKSEQKSRPVKESKPKQEGIKKPAKKTGIVRVLKEKELKKPTKKAVEMPVNTAPEAPGALRAQVELPKETVYEVVKASPASDLKVPVRKYFYSVGRRKESIATVRLLTRGSGQVMVNGKPFEQYFPYAEWREKAVSPLFAIGQAKNLDTEVTVSGGGVIGQAEAMRHAIARALLKLNPIFRKSLRKNGFLTRDPRMKERKKYGLKRARRAPQWSKR